MIVLSLLHFFVAAFELWFKQIMFELDSVRDLFSAKVFCVFFLFLSLDEAILPPASRAVFDIVSGSDGRADADGPITDSHVPLESSQSQQTGLTGGGRKVRLSNFSQPGADGRKKMSIEYIWEHISLRWSGAMINRAHCFCKSPKWVKIRLAVYLTTPCSQSQLTVDVTQMSERRSRTMMCYIVCNPARKWYG